MRDLLRGSLARSLGALTALDRLTAAWPVACGRAMAEHGEVIAFEEATVYVQVSDAAWLRQMMSLRSQLERELARIAGVPFTRIEFGIHFQLDKREGK